MADTVRLRVSVDTAPAAELIDRVRNTATEALAAMRRDGGEPTPEAVADTVAGAALAEVLRVRSEYEDAETQLARLRAGEEPGWDPLTEPMPGQWIARWNSLHPPERLQWAQAIIRDAETARLCRFKGHEQQLVMDNKAWVRLARVRDVITDMESITGARHWARILRRAVDGDEPASGTDTAAVKEHPAMAEPENSPVCAATIEGPHVPGGQLVQCTREAGHPDHHAGPKQGDVNGRILWTDHHAGATPHEEGTR